MNYVHILILCNRFNVMKNSLTIFNFLKLTDVVIKRDKFSWTFPMVEYISLSLRWSLSIIVEIFEDIPKLYWIKSILYYKRNDDAWKIQSLSIEMFNLLQND